MKRRNFLKWLFPATVAAAIPAPEAEAYVPSDPCQFYADKLAQAMQAKHGGEWVARVNHENQNAFVHPR